MKKANKRSSLSKKKRKKIPFKKFKFPLSNK